MKCVYDCVAFVLSDIESVCVYHTGFHFHNTHIYVPYSGKFSLVQIFLRKSVLIPQKKFCGFYFRGMWDALTTPLPVDATSSGSGGILYSSRLILLYSNHLEDRQTVETRLVHMGTRCMHVMTSSIWILVNFFTVLICMEAGLFAKIAKICTQWKFPAIWYADSSPAFQLHTTVDHLYVNLNVGVRNWGRTVRLKCFVECFSN